MAKRTRRRMYSRKRNTKKIQRFEEISYVAINLAFIAFEAY